MSTFLTNCEHRRDEVCGDAFDILLSCADFSEFKELMLTHKASLAGVGGLELSGTTVSALGGALGGLSLGAKGVPARQPSAVTGGSSTGGARQPRFASDAYNKRGSRK